MIGSTSRRVAGNLAWHLGLLILSVCFILLLRTIDRSFPVVKDFKVTAQRSTDNSVLIEGTLDKVRDCKFLEITAYTQEGQQLWINFLDKPTANSLDVTRPVRVQLWGPWEIFNQGSSSMTLYVHHACWPFWSQTAVLTDITLIKNESNK